MGGSADRNEEDRFGIHDHQELQHCNEKEFLLYFSLIQNYFIGSTDRYDQC